MEGVILTLLVPSPAVFHCFPSMMVSGPVRAFVELAPFALSPDTAEQVVILLSVEDGEAIKLERDLDRFCRSFALFLCCGTFVGPPELRENMLRTLLMALVIESASGCGVARRSWSPEGKSPGSSATRAGEDGREYLDNGVTDGSMHAVGSFDER